nr:hypothetical protein [Tanacetum cinerariifolium]
MGDFHAALFLADSMASGSCMDISMREFNECVENIEVLDGQQSGLKYTWNQKPKGSNGILKKLDRIMANLGFNDVFIGFHAIFKPYRVSDHSPSVLIIPTIGVSKPKPFKFYNILTYNDQFKVVVQGEWSRQEVWEIVGFDVVNAICEFFTNGTLLKELNHTIITLIPKVKSPSRVNDYQPISCCNVLFKCISKIIANRIKHSLKNLISPNQSAFVPGRSISDNILLTQELMHNYHLDRGTPRCAFNVDIQKAYDTVDWNFVRMILHGFGFHPRMISWIMEYVTTTSYSICINGSLHGYFHGKRGLRQGDPLSPYLFTLVMEILTLMLKRKVEESGLFTYHRDCSNLNLINLCFTDYLFIFSYEDVQSITIIKEALEEFKCASGLVPSLPKSTMYFCNVLNHIKLYILQILSFEEGRLLIMRRFLWSHGDIKKGKAKVA